MAFITVVWFLHPVYLAVCNIDIWKCLTNINIVICLAKLYFGYLDSANILNGNASKSTNDTQNEIGTLLLGRILQYFKAFNSF